MSSLTHLSWTSVLELSVKKFTTTGVHTVKNCILNLQSNYEAIQYNTIYVIWKTKEKGRKKVFSVDLPRRIMSDKEVQCSMRRHFMKKTLPTKIKQHRCLKNDIIVHWRSLIIETDSTLLATPLPYWATLLYFKIQKYKTFYQG